MNKSHLTLYLILIALFACKTEENPQTNNTLINSLKIQFVSNTSVSPAIIFTYTDLDGPGGMAADISAPSLQSNSSYIMALSFFNKNVEVDLTDPNYNITLQISDNAEDYQVFFTPGSNFSIVYEDEDIFDNPIGLLNTLQTRNTGQATLKVELIKSPEKDAPGASEGVSAQAGGTVIFTAEIPISIE